jgi:hypothetical protein
VRRRVPLHQRRLDIIFVIFFVVNLGFITYIVDLEQVVVANAGNFEYPAWPPAVFVDLVHWWGRTFDPVLLARPAWWKATIWIDALFFGPFYAIGIYAFVAGKDWIRIPSIIWASVLLTNVTIILSEEAFGQHATPELPIVLLANLSRLLMPILMLARMARAEHPFTVSATDRRYAFAGSRAMATPTRW